MKCNCRENGRFFMFMSWHKVQLMEYVHNSWLGTWDVKLTQNLMKLHGKDTTTRRRAATKNLILKIYEPTNSQLFIYRYIFVVLSSLFLGIPSLCSLEIVCAVLVANRSLLSTAHLRLQFETEFLRDISPRARALCSA